MVTLFSAALVQAADLRLTVERTDPLEFSWETASVTQPGSISIIPDTQLEISTDLIHWQIFGQSQTGGLDTQPVTVKHTIVTTTGLHYFRIRSQVILPKADLAEYNLIAADLRGANLSDANLANTDLALSLIHI